MALVQSIKFHGIEIKALKRIDWHNVNMLGGAATLEVQVGTYVSEEEANSIDEEGVKAATPQNAIDRKSYVLPVSKSDTSLKAAYAELLKLEEFAGAVSDTK